jgi:hypothetical protein
MLVQKSSVYSISEPSPLATYSKLEKVIVFPKENNCFCIPRASLHRRFLLAITRQMGPKMRSGSLRKHMVFWPGLPTTFLSILGAKLEPKSSPHLFLFSLRLAFWLEPARAKWTLTLQGHRARGQSARARSSQMDFEVSSLLDNFYQKIALENDPLLAPKMGW